MKKSKLFGWAFMAALTSAGFSACSNDAEEVLSKESEIKLTSEITASRVLDSDLQSVQIVEGQQVGVTITGAKGEHENVPWTVGVDGVLKNEGDDVYWGTGEAAIKAYHPYRASSWNTDGTFTFYVNSDQSENSEYLASDLLWASTSATKTNNAIPLIFEHKLSKVDVTLSSEDVEDLSGASIYICGTKKAVTFNPETGSLSTISSSVGDIKAGITTTEKFSASAVIVPQTVANNTKFIQVVLGGKTYAYTLASGGEFKSGHSYSYTLVLKEKLVKMTASSLKISNWKNNDCGEVDADETYEMTAVDLGLSVKWGSCNLGAKSATGRGDYFAWGEIKPRSNFEQENYKFWNKETSSYVNIGSEISGTEYDPATVLLGEGWRMPTKEECEELMNGCTSHATSTSGTTYYFVFTSKSNGNTISFGGYGAASPVVGNGNYGAYFLSSTLSGNSVNLIEVLADYHKATTWDRHWGYQIRPVYDGE